MLVVIGHTHRHTHTQTTRTHTHTRTHTQTHISNIIYNEEKRKRKPKITPVNYCIKEKKENVCKNDKISN